MVLDGGKAAAEAFDPKQRFIFAFHHHGLYPLGECVLQVSGWQLNIYTAHQARDQYPIFPPHPPAGAGYLPLLASFKRLLPVRPVTLTASVCVTVPLLRDIVLWLGIRIVSR